MLERERPQQCDLCGKIAELRPYGPNGEAVCFECGMKNEGAAIQQFLKRLASPSEGRELRPSGDERP